MFSIFTVLFLCGISQAQNPTHFILGKQAFSNTNIYTLLHHEGSDLIYAGTNSGLFIYSQNTFSKIKSAPEQIGSSIFQLKQNKDGDVFCCNLNGQIFKVTGSEMSLFYQAPEDNIASNFYFFFDEKDELIITTHNDITKITSQGEKKTLFKDENKSTKFYTISQTKNKDIYFPVSKSETVLYYHKGILDTLPTKHLNRVASKYFSHKNNVFSICVNGNINFNVRGVMTRSFTQKKNERLYQFNKNEIIGLGAKKGLRILSFNEDTLYEKQRFFDDLFVSAVYQKKNGTLLLGTFGEGIFVVPNKDILVPTYKHLFLGITSSPNNDVYLSTRSGIVFQVQKDNLLKKIGERESNIDNVFYTYGDFNFEGITHKNIVYSCKSITLNAIKDFHQIDSCKILMANYNGLAIYVKRNSPPPKNLHFYKKSNDINCYYIAINQRFNAVTWSLKDSLIYYATNFGVYSTEWSTPKKDTLLYKGKPFLGNSIEFNNDYLICGTENDGILFFKNNKFVKQITIQDGLKSNTIKKIKIQQNNLYLLSNEGMQVYNLKSNQFLGLGISEGIVNGGITNFTLSNDKIWLLEKHSYYAIELNQIKQQGEVSKLYLDSVLVNNVRIKKDDLSTFNYNQNAFNFYFDYRNIETKSETEIYYTLEGFYTDWKKISATQNNIEFEYLPTGNYTFKIKAKYRNSETKLQTYSFNIVPPIWNRWWFYVLTSILIIATIAIVVFYRLNLSRKKNIQLLKNKEAEKNAIDAQLKAIRAQMNPHFIFNAINSIQDLVLQQETIKSYDYLVEFSSLVRNTLDFSEREFISLKEELEFLQTYLGLEKLRFKDDFEYKIECTNDNKKSVLIPSLIVQPFIENALKHGLLHKDGAKKISILFTVKKELIACEITDNGVGRSSSDTIKKRQNRNHISFSTKAIEQRMKILNKQYDANIGYEIIDLFDGNGESTGTKVILRFPITLPAVR